MSWTPADHLDLATKHVREGERRCAGQAELIRSMKRDGRDVRHAEAVLVEMERTLTLMRGHQARLQAEAELERRTAERPAEG